MGLFSFLKRDADAAAAVPKKSAKSGAKASAADDVQLLRLRARRRLIGAAVLVAADLPIEIPRKESAPPLTVPTREPLSQAEPASTPEPAPIVAATPTPVETKVAEKPVEKPVEKPPVKVAEKPAEKPKSAAADGQRAQALLEGKEVASATAARYIVQVGAHGESKAAQEMRAKVEKLGLKTYAQAVDTADGRRIRVRLGPFASRDEAERASAKLKGAGLPGAILTL
jgi:DedD protein